jgi:hypothetical protein
VSVIGDIENTIYLLRRAPSIDIEKLSYEVTETEWRELVKAIEHAQPYLGFDLSYAESLSWRGLRIRKRPVAPD